MAVSLGDNLRVVLRFVVVGGKTISNHFFAQYIGIGVLTDEEAMDKLQEWMEDILGPLDGIMDSNVSLGVCTVDEVTVSGVYDEDPEVNTAKVDVVRFLGSIVPSFTPAQTGDQYAPQVTFVAHANTNVANVQGRKSFGGLNEGNIGEGVLTGPALAVAAQVAAEWIGGPSLHDFGTEWLAGVMSLREGEFVPFNGTGSVSNTLGSMNPRSLKR